MPTKEIVYGDDGLAIEVVTQYTTKFKETLDYNDLKQRNVVMSNIIIRSAQSLTLIEKRILMACISKMTDREVTLHAQEYAETYGIELKHAYSQIKEGAKEIFKKHIRGVFKNNIEVYINWCSQAVYENENGTVKISFSPEIMPYLINLKGHFTQYQLQQAATLRSIHSWRLMELLQQMRGVKPEGFLLIYMEDFYQAMEATETYKKNFSLFKKRVIEPAVMELMEKDGWLIDWEPLRRGRRVQALQFQFEKTKQQQFDFESK